MCTSICQNIILNKDFEDKFLYATAVFRQSSTKYERYFQVLSSLGS